jgi:hypothetical protein
MRRAGGEAMMTVGGALVLVLSLVLLNDHVRDEITAVFDAHHPAASASGLVVRLGDVVAIVAVAARQQSLEHAPLVIFSLAAAVLVFFMVRT